MREPSNSIVLSVNGEALRVPLGTTVAAAVLIAGSQARTSITGEPRGPVCGMGICFECRVTISGIPHQKSCQILCESGMDVQTP